MKKAISSILILLSLNTFGYTINELEDLAESGDKESQFKLGLAFEFGKGGLAEDQMLAERWYLKSNTDKALSRLAVMAFDSGDYDSAKKYLKKPLKNKFPFAFLYMGKILLEEDNKKIDGNKYIQFAAIKGVPEAMFLFGEKKATENDFYNAYIFTKAASIKSYIPAKKAANLYRKKLNAKQIKTASEKIKKIIE